MPYHNLTRRKFLKLAGLSIAASSAWQLTCSKTYRTTKKPNFIIFIGDDIGWNDVGAYGHPNIRTPNIDKLANDGIKFTNAFLTISSCSPSRSSILTGRYPHNTGAGELHQPLPVDQVMFVRLLKDAGYYTASAGKWHLGQSAKVNFNVVKERSEDSGCAEWVEVLQNRPQDKPFFMWFASSDPHRPYKPDIIEQPHSPDDAVVPPFLPDVSETRQDLAMYYDEISRLDNFIGKVLEELDHQRLTDNTFVLFLSDNGRPFPRCKTTIYDSGIKTPLIVRWPGKIKPGTVCESMVSSVDIAPTIIELAGLKSSPTFQGKSFVPMLKDPDKEIRKYIFAEHNWHDYQSHERCVRSKQYLYIRNAFPQLPGTPPADAVTSITYQAMQKLYTEGKLTPEQSVCFISPRAAEELYDTKNDNYSLNNFAGDPKYLDVLEEMRKVLDEWEERTNDKIPEQPTPDKFDRDTGKRISEIRT